MLAGPPAEILGAAPGAPAAGLTAAERARMDRLHVAADRDAFLAAHLLVRHCVATLAATEEGSVVIGQRCDRCGGPHGRPEVAGRPDLHVSLAHSRQVVAAAAGFVPVGVDVEPLGAAAGLVPADLAPVLAPAEGPTAAAAPDPALALLRLWVRKEALVKAGVARLDDLAGIDLSALPAGEPEHPLRLRTSRWGDWCVHDWVDDSGAVGAVVAPVGVAVVLGHPAVTALEEHRNGTSRSGPRPCS